MRFIHTSDIHYKMKPDIDMPWAKQREEELSSSLYKITQKIKNEKIDLFLIAGDLFHKHPSVKDLKELDFLFSNIPDTEIVIIAGNHDYINKKSPIYSFEWSKNVHYVLSDKFIDINIDKLNVCVKTFSYNHYEITEDITNNIYPEDMKKINILMLHGGDLNHLPFNKAELIKKGFDYYALGHIHKPEIFYGNKMAYPGSLIPLNRNETGTHGYIYGEISDFDKSIQKLNFIPFSDIEYKNIDFVINELMTENEIIYKLENLIKEQGVQNIYNININGLRDNNINLNLNTLKSDYKISDISDNTKPSYDIALLYKEHINDILGMYINEFKTKEETNEIDEKALYYGIDALLSASSERI